MNELVQLGQSHDYTDDTEKVKQGTDFVSYGEDNNYPDFLINLYQKSAVHNALCNSISTWIYGEGLSSPQLNEKSESWAKFKTLFEKGIGKNTIQKCILDLKVHGGFYLSISYSLDRTTISEVNHIPFECMRVEPELDGEESEFYLYSKDWSNYKTTGTKRIKSFDANRKHDYPNQIACFKMYSVGQYYYPKPDYQGGINYIELDKNVSEFHLANIKNGLAPSFLLSFANGIPSDEKRQAVKSQIEQELSGSKNAGKFILSFADDRANAPEITPFPLSDADKQYEFLSKEITSKVMISHRVVSPRLFGVNVDGGGLGNNADELKTASILFEDIVINNYRDILIEAMDLIMYEAGYPIKLEFASTSPFQDEEIVKEEVDIVPQNEIPIKDGGTENIVDEGVAPAEIEQVDASYNGAQISSAISIIENVSLGILSEAQAIVFLIQFLQLPPEVAKGFFSDTPDESFAKLYASKQESVEINMTDDEGNDWIEYLADKGNKIDTNEWELVDEVDVNDAHAETEIHNQPFNFFKRYAEPDSKSKIDKGLYKIRYRYSENIADNSRLFCRNMVANAKRGISYRFEDINQMSADGINKEFAERGKSKYSIWLYKGGCYCHHKFIRQVWFRKREKGRFLPNKGLKNDNDVTNETPIGQGLRNASGWRKANTRPIDMPNRGKVN